MKLYFYRDKGREFGGNNYCTAYSPAAPPDVSKLLLIISPPLTSPCSTSPSLTFSSADLVNHSDMLSPHSYLLHLSILVDC